MKAKKFELWTLISVLLLGTFILFLVYPMFGLLKQSVVTPEGEFTLQEFAKFFSKSYYTGTIVNSVKVTLSVTAIALILAGLWLSQRTTGALSEEVSASPSST